MRCAYIFPLVVVSIFGVSCHHDVDSQQRAVQRDPDNGARVATSEYLLTVANNGDIEFISALFGRFGLTRSQRVGKNMVLVEFSADPGIETLREAITHDSRIRTIQQNFSYRSQPKLLQDRSY